MNSKREEKVKLAYGQALRSFRLEAGLSQEKLAAQSGVHRNYVSDVERGLANICLLHMWKLGAVLKIAPSRIMQEAEKHVPVQ